MSRVYGIALSAVYPHYVAKAVKKGCTEADLRELMCWLTGYTDDELQHHLDAGTTHQEFYENARFHPDASVITGRICGVKLEEIEDPLMWRIRCMDKVVDDMHKSRDKWAPARAAALHNA